MPGEFREKVSIRVLHSVLQGRLPSYQTEGSSGLDLVSTISATIEPGQRMLVPCGFALELPLHLEAQVRPRSGLALKHGITLLNSPGTIDADYRGEIKVILINLGSAPFSMVPGDRIAQMVISPVTRVQLHESQDLQETARGHGGFGHTGGIST